MERPGEEWRTYTGCQDSCPGQGSKIKQHLDYPRYFHFQKSRYYSKYCDLFLEKENINQHFDHLQKFSLLMKYKSNYICDIHLFNIMTF